MTPAKIYVSARDLFKVKDFLNNNKKIDAIKYLRDAARGSRPGLREAHDAVEHLISPHALPNPRGVIASLNPIKAVTIDTSPSRVTTRTAGTERTGGPYAPAMSSAPRPRKALLKPTGVRS